jgi:hypothetical protein
MNGNGYTQGDISGSLELPRTTGEQRSAFSVSPPSYVHGFSLTTVIIVNRIMPVKSDSKPMRPDAIETSAKFVITRP